MRKLIYLIIACAFLACNGEDCDCVTPPEPCTDQVIISTELYNSGPNDDLNIVDVEIINDSIYIEFGSSGCDGESWEICLYDAEVIMESLPEQRLIRLALKNEELCDAYFTKKVVFDITPLQIESDKIYLNLEGWETQLLYDY